MINLKLFQDRPNIFMVTSNYWNGIEYQRHYLARQFAKHGFSVMFIERSPHRWPKFGLKDILEWILKSGQASSHIAKTIPKGINIIKPRFLPPARWLRPINREIIKNKLSKLHFKGKNLLNKTILITYVPSYNSIDLINLIKPCVVAYVNIHNYEETIVMPDLLRAEREIIRLSDVLFADSTFNIKRLVHLSNRRNIFPSLPGVDYKHFRQANRRYEDKRRKTIYYFGGIGPHLDFFLYGNLATKYNVVFVGVVNPVVRRKIPLNIEIRSLVANSELPEILKDADILAIFYKDSPYIRGVIPAKFFECLATGKPLLVSGLSEAEPYLDIVYDVQGSEKKAFEIIQTLSETETPKRLSKRDKIAKEADWTRRFESFICNLNLAWRDRDA